MSRALALLLLLLPALAQTVNCDATDLVFNFSASGPITTVMGYPVANLNAYLDFLDAGGTRRFMPTQVVGGSQPYRIACQITTPNGGGGSTCGAGTTRCFRITGFGGSLPAPLNPNPRLWVMVQPVSGTFTNHAPTFTHLMDLPDTRGLVSVPRNANIVFWTDIPHPSPLALGFWDGNHTQPTGVRP
ncbi:hypothetical protein, partial [Thermus sp.]|uniref:hypothetical protein n=1 Tax=Thermus sp. TaxID=275 RepID=UPI00261635AB